MKLISCLIVEPSHTKLSLHKGGLDGSCENCRINLYFDLLNQYVAIMFLNSVSVFGSSWNRRRNDI